MNRSLLIIVCLSAGLACAMPSQAATVWWNVAAGDFSDPLSWNTGTFPAVGDTVVIANAGTATLDVLAPPNAIKYLLIGAVPASSSTVFPGNGFTAGNGNFIQNGQTLEVTDQVFVAYGDSTSGPSYYTMNGGTLNIASSAAVDGYLRLGQATDAAGVMSITGSSVVNLNGLNTGIVRMGENIDSVGVILQSGNSTVNVKSALWMGMNQATAYGFYGISAGSLNLNSFGQEQYIGRDGIGVFDQSGGSVYVATRTWIGNTASAIGVVNVSGGSYSNNGAGAKRRRQLGHGNYQLERNRRLQHQCRRLARFECQFHGCHQRGSDRYRRRHALYDGDVEKCRRHRTIEFPRRDSQSKDRQPQLPEQQRLWRRCFARGRLCLCRWRNHRYQREKYHPRRSQSATGSGVGSIAITGGIASNYVETPAVRITGGGGSGATAVAVIDGAGTITGIVVTNPGVNYTSAPTVEIRGGKRYNWEWATATATLDSGNASGGITKIGNGTLTLGGANTYTGLTDVQAGTLNLTGSLAGSANVASGATLKGNGSIAGDLTADIGSLVQPGSSIGTLTVNGNASLSGTLDVEYNSDTDAIDLLAVSGQLDITGGNFSFSDLGFSTLTQPAYVFATYGSLVGDPVVPTPPSVPSGYQIDYAYGGNSIALVPVPEPASIVLLSLGLLAQQRGCGAGANNRVKSGDGKLQMQHLKKLIIFPDVWKKMGNCDDWGI